MDMSTTPSMVAAVVERAEESLADTAASLDLEAAHLGAYLDLRRGSEDQETERAANLKIALERAARKIREAFMRREFAQLGSGVAGWSESVAAAVRQW